MIERLKMGGLLVVATAILMWPMALNRGALLYTDSVSYVSSAYFIANSLRDALTRPGSAALPPVQSGDPAVGPAAERPQMIGGRSLYYGGMAYAAAKLGGFGALALVQALWCATALILLLDQFGIRQRWRQLAVITALSLFASLAFFANMMMPDVFAGLGAAALGMLLAFGNRLGRGGTLFWLATLVFACLAHMAVLLTVAATLGVVALLAWRPVGGARWLAAAGVAVAVAGTVIVKPIIERTTEWEIVPVPFLLARTIDDGTAAQVLVDACPTKPYATCRYLPHLPLTADEFLWTRDAAASPLPPGATPFQPWQALPPADRRRISAESGAIVQAAVARYPVEQLGRSTGNALRQLVDHDLAKFGWPTITGAIDGLLRDAGFGAEAGHYAATRIGSGTFPLGFLSRLWLAVYLVSAVAVAAMLVIARRRRIAIDRATLIFVATVLLAVALNAAICAAAAVTVGRYQSRMAWLVLLSAILLGHALAGARLNRSRRGPPASPI